MKVFVAAVLAFSSLSAVASPPEVATLPKDVDGARAESLGTVIGTIGYRTGMSETKIDWSSLVFRRVGSQELGSVQVDRSWIGTRGNAHALADGKFRYAAFKMALPEGRYEIIRVIGHYNTTPATMTCHGNCGITTRNERDFSVPFEVTRGRVLYLGSFLANGTLEMSKATVIPLPWPATVYFSYADKWQRDMKVFASEGEWAVDPAQVDRASLSVNQLADYYLMAEDHVPEPRVTMRDIASGNASFAGRVAAYKAAHPEGAASPP